MRKLPSIMIAAFGAAAAATAVAAQGKTNVMSVPLPDGSTARIEYRGDVPPKVIVDPAPGLWSAWRPLAALGHLDQPFERMDRDAAQMMRRIEQMARQPLAGPRAGLNVASQADLPPGTSSVSVVSVSNGAGTCTRTTEVVSQGPGKPPKVTTNVSGNCAQSDRPAPDA